MVISENEFIQDKGNLCKQVIIKEQATKSINRRSTLHVSELNGFPIKNVRSQSIKDSKNGKKCPSKAKEKVKLSKSKRCPPKSQNSVPLAIKETFKTKRNKTKV